MRNQSKHKACRVSAGDLISSSGRRLHREKVKTFRQFYNCQKLQVCEALGASISHARRTERQ